MRGALREAGAGLVSLDPDKPEEGLGLLDEALQLSRRLGSHDEMVRMLDFVADARILTGPREVAIEESLELLETIEKLRELQRDDRVRAGTLANWTRTYRRLVGYLLDGAPTESDERLAFETLERMRARVLLDRLDAAGASEPLAPRGPIAERRVGILDELAGVQRRLADASLPPDERTRLLDELTRLELEEAEARDELARSDPEFAELRRPDFPTPEEVQALLHDDEAILSYQWSPKRAAWAMVLTRESFRVYRLSEVDGSLPSEIDLLLGLIERRDGSDGDWAAHLGGKLLGSVLDDLPRGVSSLHVIPDDELWRLPFGVLRLDSAAEPLGATYRIALAPSVTLWARWREARPESAEIPVLSLADPVAPGDGGAPSVERAWTLAEGVRVGSLPRARVEGRRFVDRLAAGSVLRLGGDASESFLKTADLDDYSILHFATHALVDAVHPDRSAVLLTPGTPQEDGLLQPREIVELDLNGQVVLLSACRSAGGSVVTGEGPLSLARAFFQAGAHGVIGSLWPLRDEDASALVSALSRHLAAGESLESSIFQARRERIRAGAPAEAWAGLILMGSGKLVPIPGGRPTSWTPLTLTIIVLAGLFLAVGIRRITRRARVR